MKSRRTSHGGQQQNPSSQTSNSQDIASETTSEVQTEGHVLNWFQRTGNWIADSYKDTTQAIGDFAQRTGQAANDLYEAISETDISFENGIHINTDLDEVMDVLDPILGDMISFDREKSDNEIQLHVEKDGSIRIQTNSIALKSLQFGDYQMGSGEIQGVNIYVKQDRDAWLPGVELDKSNVQIELQKVIGRDIRYLAGEGTPIIASEVELEGFSATSIGEKSPFDEQNRGSLQFNVASAKLRGFDGAGSSVGSLDIAQANGNFGPVGGNVSMRSADAKNYQSEGVTVNSTNLQGVQGSIQQSNNGGFQSNVGASKVDVQGVSALGNNIDAAVLSGVALSGQGSNLNSPTLHNASTSIDQFQFSGIDSKFASGSSLSGSNIQGNIAGNFSNDAMNLTSLSASSGTMQAKDLNTQFVNASSVSTEGLGYSIAENGQNTVSTNQISLQNANSDFVGGSSLAASNMAVGFSTKDQKPVSISSDTLSGSNLTSKFGEADHINTQNLNVSIGDSISASAAAIKGTNLSSNAELGNHSAQSIGARDLAFNHDANGSMIQLSQGSATGINTSGGSVDHVSVHDLNAQGNIATKSGSTSIGQLNVQGANHDLGSVNAASVNGLSASSTEQGNITASVQNASVNELNSQGVVLNRGSIHNAQAQGNLSTMTGSASADQLLIKGGSHAMGSAQDVRINGLSAVANQDNYSAKINNIQGNQFDVMGNSLNQANIQNMEGHISRDFLSGSGTLGQVQADGFVGNVQAKNKNVNYAAGNADLQNLNVGFSTQEGKISTQGSFDSLQAQDLYMDGVASVSDIAISNAHAKHSEDGTSITIGDVEAQNAHEHVMGGTAGNIKGSQISLSAIDPTHYDASFGNVQAKDVQWQDATLGALNLNTTHTNIRDGSVNATVHSANLAQAQFQNDQISSTAESGSLEGIRFSGNKDNISGSVAFGNLSNVETSAAGNNINLANLDFEGASTTNQDSNLGLQLNRATASDLRVTNDFVTAGVQSANVTGAHLQTTDQGIDFGGEKGSVSGVDYVADLSKIPSSGGSSSDSFDTKKLIGTTAQRIDNAHIQASIGLNAGDYEDKGLPAVIKNDTRAHADIQIANNQIQNGSRVNLSNDLDTPLWTSVGGAYVKDNKLMADVNGWFDINAGKSINSSLGMGGKDLHSLSDYGQQIANTPKNESNSNSEGLNIVNMNQIQANGSLGLSDGTIDAGLAQVTLDQQKDGDNVAHFEATPDSISAHFARFIASSLSFKSGSSSASTKETAITGANISMIPDSQIVTGGIQNVTVESVKGKL